MSYGGSGSSWHQILSGSIHLCTCTCPRIVSLSNLRQFCLKFKFVSWFDEVMNKSLRGAGSYWHHDFVNFNPSMYMCNYC